MIAATRMPTIALLVDCGGDVGWGHFVRCDALASELRDRGCDARLFVNGELPPFAGEDTATVTGQPAGSFLPPLEADAFVLDLRRYSRVQRDDLPRTPIVVTLVDDPDSPFESDLRINPNVSARSSTGAALLSGAEYVILRSEFDAVPAPTERVPDSLVVSFGGTERGPLLGRVLAAASSLEPAFAEVVAVVPSRRAVLGSTASNVSWRSGVSNMSELLLGVEAGVIAAGTMLHEACATGLPCAAVALNSEQELEARALAERGAVLDLGAVEELTDAKIESALLSLRDAPIRAQLSNRARQVVDGGGRKRVADALLARLGQGRVW